MPSQIDIGSKINNYYFQHVRRLNRFLVIAKRVPACILYECIPNDEPSTICQAPPHPVQNPTNKSAKVQRQPLEMTES